MKIYINEHFNRKHLISKSTTLTKVTDVLQCYNENFNINILHQARY